MAQTTVLLGKMSFGGKRITFGSFTNTSTETSATIPTGLVIVEAFDITVKGSAVTGNGCTVNATTFPIQSGSGSYSEVSIPIVCDAGVDGYWRALGV